MRSSMRRLCRPRWPRSSVNRLSMQTSPATSETTPSPSRLASPARRPSWSAARGERRARRTLRLPYRGRADPARPRAPTRRRGRSEARDPGRHGPDADRGSLVNLSPTASWMAASSSVSLRCRTSSRAPRTGRARRSGSVVLETLRLYSRPNMYRAVRESFDVTLRDGERVRLEAGSWVALFPRFAHLDGEAFQAPETFVPARFVDADEPSRLRRPGASMLVFGMGKGRCPGDRYATEVLEPRPHPHGRSEARW